MQSQQLPIKLGILGCGSFVQRRILPALRDVDTIRVTCIHKQTLSEAQRIAAQFGIPNAVCTREALLQHPEVDAVFIATPNNCHEEDAIACAHAHKPTLCEKPLAPTSAAIVRMQAAFAKYGVPLFVGHSLRFKQALQQAKELLETGALGKLLHIRAYFTLPVPQKSWRHKKSFGGGVLQDIGVHLVDLIHFVTSQQIASIQALANPDFQAQTDVSEHTILALGRLSQGAFFSFECSLNAPLRSGFEVIGSKARLVSTDSLRQTVDPGETLCLLGNEGSCTYLPLKASNIYADELAHFAQVLQGAVSPLIAADIALHNQRVLDAAYTSIAINTDTVLIPHV